MLKELVLSTAAVILVKILHDGGAIFMTGIGPRYAVNFSASIFDNNRANDAGGALYVFGIGPEHNVNINRCIFRSNSVENWRSSL